MLRVTFVLWLGLCTFASAQSTILPGFPPGTLQSRGALDATTATYQGPGDIKSGAFAWFSCARAYTAAYAAVGGALCDVVDTSTGLTTCTFHAQANGFVDPTECNATACATACSIKKLYDQTSNGRDATQATLATMPLVDFSGAGGLPGIKCASTGTACVISTGSLTLAQPINLSMVAKRAGAFTTQQGFMGGNTIVGPNFGFTTSTNTASFCVNSVCITGTASDGSFHSFNGLGNGGGTSSAFNIDGSDTTGATSTNGYSAEALRTHRLVTQSQGTIMEDGYWGTPAWSATDRNNISANQHGANGYNF